MKTRLPALTALCLTLGITSCSYRVFPVTALDRGYQNSMITEDEIKTMSDVTIYLSEKDVPEGYRLLSFAEFRPFIKSYSAAVNQFYKKAVLKAKEFGGNAIIITAPNQFKIIEVPTGHKIVRLNEPVKTIREIEKPKPEKRAEEPVKQKEPKVKEPKIEKEKAGTALLDKLKEEKQKIAEKASEKAEARRQKNEFGDVDDETARAEAESTRIAEEEAMRRAEAQKAAEAKRAEAKASEPKTSTADKGNAIFNADNLQWFTSKYIYAATEQEQIQIVQALKDEIKSDIKVCKTSEEAEFISKKIDVLEAYNKALPTPSGTQAAEINGFRNALKQITGNGNGNSSVPKNFFDGSKLKSSVKGIIEKVKR